MMSSFQSGTARRWHGSPFAGQDNHATRRIRLHLVAVELRSQADVEDAGYHCVDSVLRVSVRHQPHARWHFDSNDVRSRLTRLSKSTASRAAGGNAENGFQSMLSDRIDLKTSWPGWWVRTIGVPSD